MSMDHKAYVFDYDAFQKELAPVLEVALRANETKSILAFIESNFDDLKDPYEGEPLSEDWEDSLGNRDLQEFADYALTKFYDPAEYLGMSTQWHHVYDKLPRNLQNATLGVALGQEPNYFDPGRQGAYFQSPSLVAANVQLLASIPKDLDLTDDDLESIEEYLSLLQEALGQKLGVYVTF